MVMQKGYTLLALADKNPTPNASLGRGLSYLRGVVIRSYRNARLTLARPGSLRESIVEAQPSETHIPLPEGSPHGMGIKHSPQNHDHEKGFILLMVIVTIGMVALLVTGLANLSHTELRIRQNEQNTLSAQMAAESGLEDAMHTLQTNPTWNTGYTDKVFPSGGSDSYSISISNLFPYITLTAIGKSGNAERHIVAKICLTGNSSPYTIRIDSWEEI